ncbi:MAG: copper oxidase [Polyangiaceae bacterium]|nr:copper oxidase [Polyangiaceae bacterium]
MLTRRSVLGGAALTGPAAALLLRSSPAEARPWEASYSGSAVNPNATPGEPNKDYRPVTTPNGSALPWKVVDGVKVYHLVAEEVEHEFAPGLKAKCWGYNGSVPGPTLEAVEGDRIRVYVTNRLKEPTTVHWHGVFLPNGMDGVGGLNQRSIAPGETFKYEWTFRQHGTFMYHPHHDEMTQMAMGMGGMLIVHPRNPSADAVVQCDFALMLGTWKIVPGTHRPDPNEMTDFNLLTLNARAYPGTAPLVCKKGDRVRIRLGNLSAMDHHPIHLHGFYFKTTATDGGQIPQSAQAPETTVLVPTGSTRTIEFIADAEGDWAMHCHMTHHVMNQMGHGITNIIGVDPKRLDKAVGPHLDRYMTMGTEGMGNMEGMSMPVPPNSIPMVGGNGAFGEITMGGMFTILKVRQTLEKEGDPGWYQPPPGTQASLASPEELARDGVNL